MVENRQWRLRVRPPSGDWPGVDWQADPRIYHISPLARVVHVPPIWGLKATANAFLIMAGCCKPRSLQQPRRPLDSWLSPQKLARTSCKQW